MESDPTSAIGSDGNGAQPADAVVAEILQLKERRNAVILAHNYQIPEVQDLADFVGDSLGLSLHAQATDADEIVFCGVHFMAETAAILCPGKRVLIPDPEAGCSLADSVDAESLRRWKAQYPGAAVVVYVNCSAAVKAEADYCCTSANALQVIEAIPEDREILFAPDMFLGEYLRERSGRPIRVWLGECHVHAGIRPHHVDQMFERHPGAELLIHPECGCVSSVLWQLAKGDLPADRTRVLSTAGMIKEAARSSAGEFLVATETGILHQLRVGSPAKRFVPIKRDAECMYMKMITLDKLARALRDGVHQVAVPEPIAARARRSIERMVAIV